MPDRKPGGEIIPSDSNLSHVNYADINEFADLNPDIREQIKRMVEAERRHLLTRKAELEACARREAMFPNSNRRMVVFRAIDRVRWRAPQ
jgi:hypothetical protein